LRILSVVFWMWQAQGKENERKRRRKGSMALQILPLGIQRTAVWLSSIWWSAIKVHSRGQ